MLEALAEKNVEHQFAELLEPPRAHVKRPPASSLSPSPFLRASQPLPRSLFGDMPVSNTQLPPASPFPVESAQENGEESITTQQESGGGGSGEGVSGPGLDRLRLQQVCSIA
jgi:hypothetical protein